MLNSLPPVWSVAIFAARENAQTLRRTIIAALEAATEPTVIDVLVNGNLELANETVHIVKNIDLIDGGRAITLRTWFIRLGDKAHAFNQYFEFVWPKSRIAFFIDGYVRVNANALILLDEAMSSSSDYLAGSGVPTVGSTAESLRNEMLRSGGIHGNLFALKGATISLLRKMDFKLPLGLYRTDPTLGAALSFGLNPSMYAWNPKGRIAVHAEVSWDTDKRSLCSISDVSGQVKRVLRQGQGILENLAVRNHFSIQKKAPEQLPATASDLVFQWARSHPYELLKVQLRHPLLIGLALRRLRMPRNWLGAEMIPELMFSRC